MTLFWAVPDAKKGSKKLSPAPCKISPCPPFGLSLGMEEKESSCGWLDKQRRNCAVGKLTGGEGGMLISVSRFSIIRGVIGCEPRLDSN